MVDFDGFLLLNFVGKYVLFSMDPMGSGTDPMEKTSKFRGFTWVLSPQNRWGRWILQTQSFEGWQFVAVLDFQLDHLFD